MYCRREERRVQCSADLPLTVRLGAKQMFAVTYPEFQLVAPKTGFDFSLQVNVDVVTPANAGACGCCYRSIRERKLNYVVAVIRGSFFY